MKPKIAIKMKETSTGTTDIDIAKKNKDIIKRMKTCIANGIVFSMDRDGTILPLNFDDTKVFIPTGVTWDQLNEIITIAEEELDSNSCENYLIRNKLVINK